MVQMWSTMKMKLNYHFRSNWVQFMAKTRHDNDVTNCMGAVYAENDTKLS